MVKYHLQKFFTQNKYKNKYHTETNEKVKNLSRTLGDILAKYLVGKPTTIFDAYLLQGLFTIEVQVNGIS